MSTVFSFIYKGGLRLCKSLVKLYCFKEVSWTAARKAGLSGQRAWVQLRVVVLDNLEQGVFGFNLERCSLIGPGENLSGDRGQAWTEIWAVGMRYAEEAVMIENLHVKIFYAVVED